MAGWGLWVLGPKTGSSPVLPMHLRPLGQPSTPGAGAWPRWPLLTAFLPPPWAQAAVEAQPLPEGGQRAHLGVHAGQPRARGSAEGNRVGPRGCRDGAGSPQRPEVPPCAVAIATSPAHPPEATQVWQGLGLEVVELE